MGSPHLSCLPLKLTGGHPGAPTLWFSPTEAGTRYLVCRLGSPSTVVPSDPGPGVPVLSCLSPILFHHLSWHL